MSLLMKATDAALFLGISRERLYRWAAEKVIPHKRFGRAIYFSRPELEAFLGGNINQNPRRIEK